jgi:hypothetical protein
MKDQCQVDGGGEVDCHTFMFTRHSIHLDGTGIVTVNTSNSI